MPERDLCFWLYKGFLDFDKWPVGVAPKDFIAAVAAALGRPADVIYCPESKTFAKHEIFPTPNMEI